MELGKGNDPCATATIAFTVIVWPHDTSFLSIISLVFCILFGLLYQDAPKRVPHSRKGFV